MKIAITGGAGFIGRNLTRAYLDAGHDVFVIDSAPELSQALDPRARFYQLDIRDPKLQVILQLERPDIVSHHAARRECMFPGALPVSDADVNVRGLLNVLDSCVGASVQKLIFASNGNSLYGRAEQRQLPLKETHPLDPQRPQDISKLAGEWYVRYYAQQYRLPHTILRYADVYGELEIEQSQHPLTAFIYMLLEKRRPVIRSAPLELRDHIYIGDAVRANLAALERGENQTFHISTGYGQSLEQFYHLVAKSLKTDIQPAYLSNHASGASSTALDNTHAQSVLDWHPEDELAQGVEQTIGLICERLGQPLSWEQPQVVVQRKKVARPSAAAIALA